MSTLPTDVYGVQMSRLLTLVLGTILLAMTLGTEPGDWAFYPLSLLLAGCWIVGGLLHRQWVWLPEASSVRSQVVEPLLVGLALAAIFAAGGVVAASVPMLEGRIDDVLGHANGQPLLVIAAVTLVSGIGEEMFFRGALYDALPDRLRLLSCTVIYTLVTLASLNAMLALAAAVLGLVTGMVRDRTGGVLAPVIVHVTWSLSMLLVLPWLLDRVS